MGGEHSKCHAVAVVEPGALSDAEVLAVRQAFAANRGEDGALGAAGMAAALKLEWCQGAGTALCAVSGRGSAVSLQAFLDMANVMLRGADHRKAALAVCAALGVSALNDVSSGESVAANVARVGAIFELAFACLEWETAPAAIDAAPFAESVLDLARDEIADDVEPDRGALLISAATVARWCERHAPALGCAFAAHAKWALCGSAFARLAAPIFCQPSEVLAGSDARRAQLTTALALCGVSGKCTRIYGSGENGLSFYRLCHQLIGWDGPTLLLIRATPSAGERDGDVFGAFFDTPWKENYGYFGGPGCKIFALRPKVKLCRPRRGAGHNSDYMYLNMKGSPSRVRGICIGSAGSADSARIHLPEDLADARVKAKGACLAFEQGSLAPTSADADGQVEIDSIEFWGVGDDSQLLAAARARKGAQANRADYIQRARQVDKAKFLDSDFDKEHLFGKTFAGGSASCNR